MRIHDIINEAQEAPLPRMPPGDPLLGDPNIARLINHYLSPAIWPDAIKSSPYSPHSFPESLLFQQIKPYWDALARDLKPLAAAENPDVNKMLAAVKGRIPPVITKMGIGIPPEWEQRVAQQLAYDAKPGGWTMRPPTATAVAPAVPAAPTQSAEPAPASDTGQLSSLQ